MRSGTIKAINASRGMIGVLTEDDAYTIIEMLSDDNFEVGDNLTWSNDYGMGHTKYRNVTKGYISEVYVQNHAVQESSLRRQLLF